MNDIYVKDYASLSKEELYALLQLRNEVFIVEQNCPYQDLDEKDFVSHHLMIWDNELLVGYCRLIPPKISFIEHCIGRVCSKKTHRNQSIGKAIMENAINWMKMNWDVPSIRISAQAYLLKFYKDFGFEKVSEEYLEDGLPHYEMLWLNTKQS